MATFISWPADAHDSGRIASYRGNVYVKAGNHQLPHGVRTGTLSQVSLHTGGGTIEAGTRAENGTGTVHAMAMP